MVEKRHKKLIDKLGADFEAALIMTPANRFYLLGAEDSQAGSVLLFADKLLYFVDSRYIEVAKQQIKHAQIILEEDVSEQIREILHREGVNTLLLEDGITVAQCNELQNKLKVFFVEMFQKFLFHFY